MKTAVVLTGSGIRGYAGIALKEIFEHHQWPVDLIIGSGGGAIPAALWASGYTAAEMLKIAQRLPKNQAVSADLGTFFTFFHHPFGFVKKSHALLKSEPLISAYRKIWGNTKIEDLPIPLILGATDVDTATSVSIAEGDLAPAVYASRATLPFFPAIEINGRWLVDGVFSQPLPISFAIEQGADIVIALNCEMASPEKPDNFIAFYANFVAQAANVAHRGEYPLMIDFHEGEVVFITVHVDNLRSAVNWEEINKIITKSRNTIKNHEVTMQSFFNSR